MRVPEELRDCVCFVSYRCPDGSLRLAGTAFFVMVQPDEAKELDIGFTYIVTAKHVVVKAKQKSHDGKIYLRVNVKKHGAVLVEATNGWRDHPTDTSVDCSILPAILTSNLEFRFVPSAIAATPEVITKHRIGVGDEIFLTGLFVNHAGRKRNIPIIRVGNIAAMPEERIDTPDFGPVWAYLVESRSIGGLSGSPVFVSVSGVRGGQIVAGGQFYWLGLMRGHWDGPLSEADGVMEDVETQDRVNMGIAIVIPVEQILEVLDAPELAAGRDEGIERQRASKALVEDDGSADGT